MYIDNFHAEKLNKKQKKLHTITNQIDIPSKKREDNIFETKYSDL